MTLAQYAGMTADEKLMVVITKLDGLERQVANKPCPSPLCLECRTMITNIEDRLVRVETEREIEKETADNGKARASWFWPMVVSTALALVGFYLGMASAP